MAVKKKKKPITGTSWWGVVTVARFEGFVDHVYRDVVGVPTIGYGETDPAIIAQYRNRKMTRAAALKLLRRRLNEDYFPVVKRLNPPSQPIANALTSFVYNVGTGALRDSTAVGRACRAGKWMLAADELLKWDMAGGKHLDGLRTRRMAERAMILRGLPTP